MYTRHATRKLPLTEQSLRVWLFRVNKSLIEQRRHGNKFTTTTSGVDNSLIKSFSMCCGETIDSSVASLDLNETFRGLGLSFQKEREREKEAVAMTTSARRPWEKKNCLFFFSLFLFNGSSDSSLDGRKKAFCTEMLRLLTFCITH